MLEAEITVPPSIIRVNENGVPENYVFSKHFRIVGLLQVRSAASFKRLSQGSLFWYNVNIKNRRQIQYG